MNRASDKSLRIKAGWELPLRSRAHNPFPAAPGGCSIFELREEATRPVRTQKKAKLPNGNTLAGVTKQLTCRAPEPVFPTGTKAPKPTAAMLRVASSAGDSARFMGTIKGRPRQFSLSMNRAEHPTSNIELPTSKWLPSTFGVRCSVFGVRLGSWPRGVTNRLSSTLSMNGALGSVRLVGWCARGRSCGLTPAQLADTGSNSPCVCTRT
jgi:hypothetical protein